RLVTKQASTPGGIRTPNLRLRRPLLYPVELQALESRTYCHKHFRSIGRAAKAVNFAANLPYCVDGGVDSDIGHFSRYSLCIVLFGFPNQRTMSVIPAFHRL